MHLPGFGRVSRLQLRTTEDLGEPAGGPSLGAFLRPFCTMRRRSSHVPPRVSLRARSLLVVAAAAAVLLCASDAGAPADDPGSCSGGQCEEVDAGVPTYGTCAGMILLANDAVGKRKGGQALVGGLKCTVCRNYFGAQAPGGVFG